jgi:hypothetical protein
MSDVQLNRSDLEKIGRETIEVLCWNLSGSTGENTLKTSVMKEIF